MASMWTKEQVEYLTEVLGVAPSAIPTRQVKIDPLDKSKVNGPNDVLVLTPLLNNEEQALLAKILNSVRLKNFAHEMREEIDVDDFVKDGEGSKPPHHVLVFSDQQESGCVILNHSTVWKFYSLQSMTGKGAGVDERKKTVWNLLKEFQKEKGDA